MLHASKPLLPNSHSIRQSLAETGGYSSGAFDPLQSVYRDSLRDPAPCTEIKVGSTGAKSLQNDHLVSQRIKNPCLCCCAVLWRRCLFFSLSYHSKPVELFQSR